MTGLSPVYIKDKEFRDPGEHAYYVVAANGVFLVKSMGLYESSIRIDAANLLTHTEYCRPAFGSIPRSLVCSILGFFRTAFLWHGGEAIVFLYYSAKERSFAVNAPPQWVFRRMNGRGIPVSTGLHVMYAACDRPAGYLKLGTIHSHADGSAYHSCTDAKDEEFEDGLHITIGRVHTDTPDFSVSFVVNGRRFMLRPEDTLEGYRTYDPVDPPPSWMWRITCIYDNNGTFTRKKLRYGRKNPDTELPAA